MQMKPTGNHVLVKHVPAPETSGGIHLLPTSINNSDVLRLQVVSTGPGRRTKKGALVPVEVQAGDVVLWQSYRSAPQPVADGFYLIDAAEIMGVIYRSVPGPAAA